MLLRWVWEKTGIDLPEKIQVDSFPNAKVLKADWHLGDDLVAIGQGMSL
jgi:hypothetical protein